MLFRIFITGIILFIFFSFSIFGFVEKEEKYRLQGAFPNFLVNTRYITLCISIPIALYMLLQIFKLENNN